MNTPRQLAEAVCFFCRGAQQQARRLGSASAVPRRKLSSTAARRAQPQEKQTAPSMHTMREHYNKKNRTVMYGYTVDFRSIDLSAAAVAMARNRT